MKSMNLCLLAAVLLSVIGGTALWGQTPRTAEEFVKRGLGYVNNGDPDRAIADFT